ncbi:hypothetical protein [Sphingomonas sp. DT-204]|uniref:hypothetical protein n=1 Tax=Sphingomonas sp. DT-204 TaxID=3396166 RepID=UPI003F19CD50
MTHAARFPDATSLIEMAMKDGDVQPVLDMVRDLQQRSDVVTETYVDFPVPLFRRSRRWQRSPSSGLLST